MKKFLFIYLLINLLINPLFAKEKTIDTPYGEKTIIIPDSKEDLEDAFVEMMEIYYDQKYDLEQLINMQETLKDDIKELQNLYVQYQLLLLQIENIKVDKIDLIDNIVLIGIGSELNFQELSYEVKAGYGIILLEKFQVALELEFPFTLKLQFGIIF